MVDAADYTTWRDGLGTDYTQADYDLWRLHFGESLGTGAAALLNLSDSSEGGLGAVPEPASLLLAMLACLTAFVGQARHAVRAL